MQLTNRRCKGEFLPLNIVIIICFEKKAFVFQLTSNNKLFSKSFCTLMALQTKGQKLTEALPLLWAEMGKSGKRKELIRLLIRYLALLEKK